MLLRKNSLIFTPEPFTCFGVSRESRDSNLCGGSRKLPLSAATIPGLPKPKKFAQHILISLKANAASFLNRGNSVYKSVFSGSDFTVTHNDMARLPSGHG